MILDRLLSFNQSIPSSLGCSRYSSDVLCVPGLMQEVEDRGRDGAYGLNYSDGKKNFKSRKSELKFHPTIYL